MSRRIGGGGRGGESISLAVDDGTGRMQSFESSSFSLIPLLALSYGTCSYPSRKSFLYVARLSLLFLLLNFPKTRTGRMANCMQQHHEKFPTGAKKKGFGRPFWLLWSRRKKPKPLSFPRFYSPIPSPGIWSCFCRKDILVELWVRRPSPVGGLLQPGTCSFHLAISNGATTAPELQVEKKG